LTIDLDEPVAALDGLCQQQSAILHLDRDRGERELVVLFQVHVEFVGRTEIHCDLAADTTGDELIYQHGSHYYDYDRDGVYDAYVSYSDWDGDGLYEDYDYYSLSDAGTQQQKQRSRQQQQQQPQQASRQQTISGQIQNTKQVQVRGAEHLVAQNLNLKSGDSITVKGPRSRVGEHSVVLARSIEAGGQTHQIDRQRRQVQGKVLSTHRTSVRGTQHLIAMVELPAEGQRHRGLPESGLAAAVRGVCRNVCRTVPLGAVLHAGQ
jgi:hypothetical protein